jgi:phenylalanyl-tRNA synthetase beta chain
MPNVEFDLSDLESLLGRPLPHDPDNLNSLISYVKGDVQSLEGDIVAIEVKDSNRPDIWCVEGIAQALKGYLAIGKQWNPKVKSNSKLSIIVDKGVEPIRPFISAAIVRGLNPSEQMLKGWIGLQEKLDQTYGRKRKKASIGLYQADMVEPPLSYTLANPDEIKFVPLGTQIESSLRQIVSQHPKGIEYGSIISSFNEWPILVDGKGQILSLPPIINSNDLGKITPGTRNVLIEVTGTNAATVHNTLKIVALALAVRGGAIYSCIISYPYGKQRKTVTPNLAWTSMLLKVPYVNMILGTNLTGRETKRFIERAGYRVRSFSKTIIQLEIPSYRIDIMHSVDIIEDIAIAMNVNKLKPEWPRIWTIGSLSQETMKTRPVDDLMIGLGFQQVLTYALTSPIVVNENMNVQESTVELLNPSLLTRTIVRSWLLPSLFEFLSHNTHVDYPQKIFEVGRCATRSERILRESQKLAAVTIHGNAGFTEIKSAFDALAMNLGEEFQIEAADHPSFLPGRCANILSGDENVGIIGEVSPLVLRKWGLSLPAAAFELDLSKRLGLNSFVWTSAEKIES